MKRLKLSSKERVQVSPGAGSLRAPGEGVVTLGEKGAGLRLTKTVIGLVLAAIVVIFTLYVALAATLMRAIPEWDNFPEFTWVKNATFVAGVPEPGDHAYISGDGPADNSLTGHLKQAFVGVESGYVVEVVGGPYGELSVSSDGSILIDGRDTGYDGPQNDKLYLLDNQYISKCVVGACGEPGSLVIVDQDTIIGEAEFHFSGDTGFTWYSTEPPATSLDDMMGSEG